MANYSIITTKRFLRHLRKLDHSIRERVLDAVQEISENPHTGSTLVHGDRKLSKCRVGDHRLIYEIDDAARTVTFIIVDHRRRVYRDLT